MTDNITLTDGSPVTPDHKELKSNGQQKDYVVLSEEDIESIEKNPTLTVNEQISQVIKSRVDMQEHYISRYLHASGLKPSEVVLHECSETTLDCGLIHKWWLEPKSKVDKIAELERKVKCLESALEDCDQIIVDTLNSMRDYLWRSLRDSVDALLKEVTDCACRGQEEMRSRIRDTTGARKV